ncbi:hypothetical protein GM415_03770 [Pseudodesulfovibrio cashew]|uniref:Uncharacterized protein n=1 Tax=Pseudodesulfovibrio cashew TaxID=2678688 RepID=A0A6I6JFF3_9BACT|nr:hypothetical protein [Pseudodesulfovibrio cashew]QGY39273.1 hypothetical protein GM415_03770 [Pseudodesulfovibrio cashew]
MRYFGTMLVLAATVVILTLSPAGAAKFKNKDTAKNRQNNVFGTEPAEGDSKRTTFGKDENGDTTIRTKHKKQEEVDWYDKVIITVDPNVDWSSD